MSVLLLVLNILGSISLFLFGMKVLSDGVQRAAGGNLKIILNKTLQNNFTAFLTGVFSSVGIQSSSAVSVFTLSFVNAGLVGVKRALTIIIGANVGTTFTLWMVLLGFTWKFSGLAVPLICFGLPLLFFKNKHIRNWGNVIIGIALIFIALNFIQNFLPDFSSYPKLNQWILSINEASIANQILFVFIGMVLTIILHLSSVSILLSAVLFHKGLPMELAAMIILGANIGTTFTAQIAATIGNTETKWVANFHTIFNVVGVALFFFFVPATLKLLLNFIPDNQLVLAAFDTFFNAISAVLGLVFIEPIYKLIEKRITKSKSNHKHSLEFITNPFGTNTEMYLLEINMELSKFAGIIKQIINVMGRLITESDELKFEELRARTFTLEEESDQMEKDILNFTQEIYQYEMSGDVSKEINKMIEISYHLESICDMAIKTASIQKDRRSSQSFITPRMRNILMQLQDALATATTTLIQNLSEGSDSEVMKTAKSNEKNINKLYKEAEEILLKTVDKDKEHISTVSALYFKELIQNYEIIGDHLYKANKILNR